MRFKEAAEDVVSAALISRKWVLDPDLRDDLVEAISNALHTMSCSASARIARYMLDHKEGYVVVATQGRIARDLGISRTYCSTVVNGWIAKGWVQRKGRKMIITHEAELKCIAPPNRERLQEAIERSDWHTASKLTKSLRGGE